ncbi:MAG: hypothetical protein HKN30_18285 [Sulfitobacter sp.]|nr:hypothetical protein [Sulfitobacter sp.]
MKKLSSQIRPAALVLALIIAPFSLQARGFFPDLGLQVNRVDARSFEVIEARGAGARDIWCAAARYAIALGRDRGRIWVAEARGPARTVSGATGVVFTTEAVEGARSSVSVTVRRVGENLLINHALQFCRDRIRGREDGL